MAYFPFYMRGKCLRVLLVGGGSIAAAKLETVAAAGAAVTIVAPQCGEGMQALIQRYGCHWLEDVYHPELLTGMNLVIVATDDPDLGQSIAADAARAGIWINVVDHPGLCDFIFPAMIRRDDLLIAISTGGTSPVLARLLKQEIEQLLPIGVERLAGFIQTRTPDVRSALPDLQQRRLFWERLLRGPVGRMLAGDQPLAAEAWFEAALAHARNRSSVQRLQLIQIRSFDPDDLTVRQVRQLGRADTILYAGGRGLLPLLERYARRDGVKVGLRPGDDPVARYRDLLEQGGILAYLAPVDDADHDRICAQFQTYAVEHGIPVEIVA